MDICHCFCHLVSIFFSSARNSHPRKQNLFTSLAGATIKMLTIPLPLKPRFRHMFEAVGINKSTLALHREASDAVKCAWTGSLLTRMVAAEESSWSSRRWPWQQLSSSIWEPTWLVPVLSFSGGGHGPFYQCTCRCGPWLLALQTWASSPPSVLCEQLSILLVNNIV